MTDVTIPVPDDFAARFGSASEFGRRALEALAIEEFRAGRLVKTELGDVLGLQDHQIAALLEQHGLAELRPPVSSDDDLVTRFKAFAAEHAFDGLSVKALIDEGRR